MCRAERIVKPEAVQQEIDVYNELLPGPGELAATLLVEITDVEPRDRTSSTGSSASRRASTSGSRSAADRSSRGSSTGRAARTASRPSSTCASRSGTTRRRAAALESGPLPVVLHLAHPHMPRERAPVARDAARAGARPRARRRATRIAAVILHLLRHAEAEDVSPSGRDADRRLTEDGRRRMKSVAKAIAADGPRLRRDPRLAARAGAPDRRARRRGLRVPEAARRDEGPRAERRPDGRPPRARAPRSPGRSSSWATSRTSGASSGSSSRAGPTSRSR